MFTGKYKVSVIVIDGVKIGHPCCSIHNCHTPLSSNHNWFCEDHWDAAGICAIVGCSLPSVPDTKTCSNEDHQKVKKTHIEHGQSRFQLQEHLAWARITHPDDSLGKAVTTIDELVDVDEGNKVFELPTGETTVSQAAHTSGSAQAVPGKKFRAQFGWTYHMPGTMPDHIFFDNNCQLSMIVQDDLAFKNIGLSVDVFHFKIKHKATDVFCQANCNPVDFPELEGLGTKAWYFNSSIAEQTNVWFSSYHSMCHEMLVDKYNFFLDEMILCCNHLTCNKLAFAYENPKTFM